MSCPDCAELQAKVARLEAKLDAEDQKVHDMLRMWTEVGPTLRLGHDLVKLVLAALEHGKPKDPAQR